MRELRRVYDAVAAVGDDEGLRVEQEAYQAYSLRLDRAALGARREAVTERGRAQTR